MDKLGYSEHRLTQTVCRTRLDFTDGNGRYQFRLPSGGAKLYFDALPEGFAYPQPQTVKHLDIQPGQADVQNLDFTIQRQSPRDR
jgi:hypothetical protein